MRQLYHRSFVTAIAVFFLSVAGLRAQVGIGTPFRTQTPNANAVLHLESDAATPQGFLMPRLDRTKFVGLTSSDNGMIIYDQTDNQFYYWLNNQWTPLNSNSAASKDAWLSGTGLPDNAVGKDGDFYFDLTTKDLYRKNSSGAYTKLFSFDSDRFWQSNTPLINTYTNRNVGIGVINPTEKLEVNGSIVSTALKSTGNQVLVGDANGKILSFSNAKGILTNDGNGMLTWEPLVGPAYRAGTGIAIASDVIENVGDTDPADDVTETSVADGEITGTFYNLTIKSGSISEDKLGDGAITEQKLADGSVTDVKIADQSISTAKIAPPLYGNMQLVTDSKGVVTWVPATTATLGDGEIAIGTASGVNSVVPGQDISLASNGKATVLGLLGRPLDNIKTPLINHVLTYNGTQWTYDYIDALTSTNGDVQGSLSNTTVTALQNYPLAATAPANGDLLQWISGKWTPSPLSLTGDVSGLLNATTVQQIQNRPLDASLASLSVLDASKVLTWNGSQWAAQNVPAFTLPNTGNGRILIGNGSTVNSVTVSGDISLANDGTTQLTGLQGKMLSASNPLTDQILRYNGSAWVPSTVLPAGDLEASTNTLTNLQGRSVLASSPTINNVLTWTGTAWEPKPISTFSLPNTGNGAILVGNGTNVNTVTVTGDVSLLSNGTTQITRLQGETVSATSPAANQVLKYNGSSWIADSLLGVGDLNASTNTLQSLQGQPLSMASPSLNNVLTWTGTAWQPQPIPSFSLPNTADGQLLVGNGSTVNTVSLSGDVSLTNSGTTTVNRLRGVTVNATAPVASQVLQYDGTQWTPTTIASSLNGDASGAFSSITVQKIQNTPLDASISSLAASDANKVLTWNGTRWQAQAVSSFTLPNTGNGQILIGNGSAVNSVAMSGDVYVANNGTATTVGLLGRAMDNTATPAVNQVLMWDGGKWTYATVDATTSASGDVQGLLSNTTVKALQGVAIRNTTPVLNQALVYDGSQWAPASLPNTIGGDATGSLSAVTVNKIQGTNVDPNLASGLSIDKVLTWDGTQWIAKTVAIPGAVNVGAGEFSIGQGGSTAARTITGDVSINTNGQASVQKLATNPLDNTVLSVADANKALVWDGTKWVASTVAAPTLNGDVTGAAGATAVEKIRGTTVDASIGSLNLLDINKVLAWNGTQWVASPVGSLVTLSTDATKLQGVSVTTAAPATNQVLTYNGSEWVPANAFSMPVGDVNTSTNTVQKIQGYNVSATAPAANQVLSYNSGSSRWEPTSLAANLWTETSSVIYLNTTKPVGIGLTNPNPAHALQVNGEIRSPGVFTDNLRLGNSSGPIPGTLWFNTASGNGLFTGRDNTQAIDFVTVPSGGAAGDLLYHNGTNWTRLGLGTTGQLLTATGTGVQWQNSVTGINATQLQGQNINTATPVNGNLLLYDSGEWKPRSLIDIMPLSTGRLWIGNASNQMTEQTVSQDATLATDGKLTVQGIQGKPVDASAASLTAADNGKVLSWDGVTSKWTPKTPAAVTIPALETQAYSAVQTRYYAVDATEFVSTDAGGNVTYTGIRGNAVSPTSGSSTYVTAALHLPHGAVLTEITFLCYDDKVGKDITFYYTKNSLTGGTSDVGTISSTGSAGDQTRVYTTSDTIDNQNFSYKITAVFNDNSQKVYGVRIKYTVTKPD